MFSLFLKDGEARKKPGGAKKHPSWRVRIFPEQRVVYLILAFKTAGVIPPKNNLQF